MCWSKEMRDVLPKEKPLAVDSTLEWYLHELLLTFKFNNKEKFYQTLSALKPYLSVQVIHTLTRIADQRCW